MFLYLNELEQKIEIIFLENRDKNCAENQNAKVSSLLFKITHPPK